MYSRIIKSTLSAYLAAFAAVVSAQAPASMEANPAPHPMGAPALATATPPLVNEGPAPDPDAVLLGVIRQQVDVKKARAEELGVDIQIQESRNKLDGGTSAGRSASIPDLIGLYGTGRTMTAEFIVGGTSVLTARRGDWVTGDWQIESILGNGVVLRQHASRERRTVLFGRRSVPGTLVGAASPAPFPEQAPAAPAMAGGPGPAALGSQSVPVTRYGQPE